MNLAVNIGDILWCMVGERVGDDILWRAKSKRVVKVSKKHNNAFFFGDGTGASQNSVGRNYFKTKEEAEQNFEEKWRAEQLEDGSYRTDIPHF